MVRAIATAKAAKGKPVVAQTTTNTSGTGDTMAVQALNRLGDLIKATSGVVEKKDDKPKVFMSFS